MNTNQLPSNEFKELVNQEYKRETKDMNQYSKIWYKYATNGMNKYSKNMVKYPTKHSNNIQNKRETNRQQQPKAISGIQIPETLRNTATEHRPPSALSARRGRNPSADHLQPSTTAALALRNSPAGHIIPLGTSARSIPLSPVPRSKQTRINCFQRAKSDPNTLTLHQIRGQKYGNPNHQ